ncbi:hypothetical protein ACFL1V_02975 [Pseudomonadota bacterium]
MCNVRQPEGLLLLEPDLIDLGGHFFFYATELARVCSERSIRLVIVARRGLNDTVRSKLESQGATVEAEFGRIAWFRPALPIPGIRFALTCIAAIRRYPQYLPVTLSGRVLLIPGAIWVALAVPGKYVFQVINWQTRPRVSARIRGSMWMRYCAGLGYRAGLRYTAESAGYSPLLSKYLGQKVDPMPTLASWPPGEPKTEPPGPKPRVGILGAARWEKNLAQFVKAATLSPTGYQLVVQDNSGDTKERRRYSKLVSSITELSTDCEIINGQLNPLEFRQLLGSLDVTAIPIQPKIAATTASGIFTMAVGLGTIPVIPAGSLMAKQAEIENIGVVYDDYSAEGLRRALDYAAANRVKLRQDIMALAMQWRRRHDADALLDSIIASSGDCGQ